MGMEVLVQSPEAMGALMDADFSTNGLMARIGAGSYTTRSVAVGSGLGVANGDGVAGNPTVSLGTELLGLSGMSSNGLVRRTGAGTYTNRLDNLAAAVAPTANEDSGDGYSVGSVWYDTTAAIKYVCLDATLGAAVWKRDSFTIGTDVQGYDATLAAFAGIATGADQIPFSTGSDTFSQFTAASYSRGLMANADQAAWQSALGITATTPQGVKTIGTGGDYATLAAAIAALTTTAFSARLIEAVTETGTVTLQANIVFDLNSYTWATGTHQVVVGANRLWIEGRGNGTITSTIGANPQFTTLNAAARLYFKDVIVDHTNVTSTSAQWINSTTSGATTFIEGYVRFIPKNQAGAAGFQPVRCNGGNLYIGGTLELACVNTSTSNVFTSSTGTHVAGEIRVTGTVSSSALIDIAAATFINRLRIEANNTTINFGGATGLGVIQQFIVNATGVTINLSGTAADLSLGGVGPGGVACAVTFTNGGFNKVDIRNLDISTLTFPGAADVTNLTFIGNTVVNAVTFRSTNSVVVGNRFAGTSATHANFTGYWNNNVEVGAFTNNAGANAKLITTLGFSLTGQSTESAMRSVLEVPGVGSANTGNSLTSATLGGSGNALVGGSSVILGGGSNTNESTGVSSVVSGHYANATRHSERAQGVSTGAAGRAQFSRVLLYNATTDATETELFTDGTGATARLTCPASATLGMRLLITARDSGGNALATWDLGVVNASRVGSGNITVDHGHGADILPTRSTGADAAVWKINITADTTNQSVKITVKGGTAIGGALNVRWVVTAEFNQVTYA